MSMHVLTAEHAFVSLVVRKKPVVCTEHKMHAEERSNCSLPAEGLPLESIKEDEAPGNWAQHVCVTRLPFCVWINT